MTDRSNKDDDSRSDGEFHEFSAPGGRGDDPLQTGSFTPPAGPHGDASRSLTPTSFGRYQVLGFLGKGSFGTVYVAQDTQLRRKVAVKVPHRNVPGDTAAQFLHEARRLAQLKHPGIVTVFDVGHEGGRCYIVSDFVTGVSLKEWLRHNRPTWDQTTAVVAAAADALAHAHGHGVIHRDVKPSNIVLTEGLRPVLLDFGLALSETEAAAKAATAVGTPAYMSPEQARGEGHRIDGRTDVFSLGVVLFEMLCGRRPFHAPDVYELMRQVREDDPRPPRQISADIPRELERICLKAIANRLADRYTTAGDMAADLRAYAAPTADAGPAADRTETHRVCPACRRPFSAGALTCAGCGAALTPAAPSAPRPASEVGTGSSREAERRQVTILYCNDSIGESVELLEALDPEEQHALVERCRQACHETAARYGGTVLVSAGAGTVICFGYPTAYEDAPRRAVHTGLTILKALAHVGDEVHRRRGLHLSAWAAVHTGLAIVGGGGGSSGEPASVAGEARIVAARLEPFAEPGALVISEATHKLVEGFFISQNLGRHAVKGLAQPAEVYRVLRPSEARGRIDVVGASGLTPLVGRDQEVGLLTDRWQRALEGQGQAVMLGGEAGIGKSRLVHVLKECVRDRHEGEGRPVVEWRCSPYHQNSGLYPATDYFERHLRFRADDAPRDRFDKLTALLRPLDLDRPDVAPLFAALLSLPSDVRYPPSALSPQRQRERTLEVLLDWLIAHAQQQPTLFIVEDLHWIDATTLEFLGQVVDQAKSAPLLVVCTSRPEYSPPWAGHPDLTKVALNRLTRGQIAEMIGRKTGMAKAPPVLVDQIAARTDGVPLFVEEFTRMLQESGAVREVEGEAALTGSFQGHAIPASLQDLLLARLDRMGSVRDVVQLASAVGRDFSYALLRAVCPLDEAALRRELTKLIEAEILFAKGRPPQSSYRFKHALIQDAAYQSLLKPRRREFHRLLARALETEFSDKAEREPELVARHYTEAGQAAEAAAYWEKAGQRALERSAVAEATAHLTAGLALLPEWPEAPERDAQEFRLQFLLGVAVMAAEGYGSPRLPAIHGRARHLCVRMGAKEPLFQVLWGIWAWSFIRDEMDFGAGLARELTRLAGELDDPGYRMEATFAAACNSFYRGEFAEARGESAPGIAAYTPERGRQHARYTGQNSGVTNRCYHAFSLWYLGYADQAAACVREAVALAEGLGHPFSRVFALYHNAFLSMQRRLGDETCRAGAEVRAAATEQGFPFWAALGSLEFGTGLLLQGAGAGAVEALRDGLASLRATGAEIVAPYYTGRLAEAYLAAGRFDDAARALDETVALGHKSKELFAEAEWHRLRGDLLLARVDDRPGAEGWFRQALETACRRGARLPELRAATSLARLLESQGRADEARRELATVYGWFTEGFDAADLKEARALLDGLKHP